MLIMAFGVADISIHAPRTGSDEQLGLKQIDYELFQSTLPARGATFSRFVCTPQPSISIHAPRTGSDRAWATW